VSPRVVAMGGCGFSIEPYNALLDRFVLSLARSPDRRGISASRLRTSD
jgi:hypothetical protein